MNNNMIWFTELNNIYISRYQTQSLFFLLPLLHLTSVMLHTRLHHQPATLLLSVVSLNFKTLLDAKWDWKQTELFQIRNYDDMATSSDTVITLHYSIILWKKRIFITEVDNVVAEDLPTLGGDWRVVLCVYGSKQLETNITPNYSLLRCSWRLKVCSCWVSGASGRGDGREMTQLWSPFAIYRCRVPPRYQRGDLVVVRNCVNVLPHAVPGASSVSSPNLRCLSSEKWYPPQIRIQCRCPGQPARKGSPVSPVRCKLYF